MNTGARSYARVSGQLVVGLLLAALGILFMLDNLHILHAREILRYWPVVFVVVGISQILQSRSTAGMVGGSIWILFGGILLGDRLSMISNALRFWPLFLVGVGGYVVLKSFHREEVDVMPGDPSARISAVSILGGVDRRVTSTKFEGADITAFMGGGKLDLRDAIAAPGSEAVVDVTAMMGGYEIKIPESWNVIVDVIPFMGGYEDKTRHPTDPTAPRLRVRGFVMMGGVEIRN